MSECSQTNSPVINISEDPCHGTHLKSLCVFHAPSIFLLGTIANTNLQDIITAIVSNLQTQVNNISSVRDQIEQVLITSQDNPQKIISADYTLQSSDYGYTIFVNNGGSNVRITIPLGLTQKINIRVIQQGTGQVSFQSVTGVVIKTPTSLVIRGQNYDAHLEKVGTTEVFHLTGNLAS